MYMPYADEKKKAEHNTAFQKNTYFPPIHIKIRKSDQDFYEAIRTQAESLAITPTEFMKVAAREKLVRDGYLSENKDAE